MFNGALAILGFSEAQGVLNDWQTPQNDGSVQFIIPDNNLPVSRRN
jgi:hypothetical protein